MDQSTGYLATQLLARAKYAHHKGEVERAVELLNQVIALYKGFNEFANQYPYRSAHIELYKIHRALGRDDEAGQHYQEAIKLGAKADELEKEE